MKKISLVLLAFISVAVADDGSNEAARIYTYEREQQIAQGKTTIVEKKKKVVFQSGEEIFISTQETEKTADLAVSMKAENENQSDDEDEDVKSDQITLAQGAVKIFQETHSQGDLYENTYFINVKGKLDDRRKTLIYKNKIIELSSKGYFEFRHYLKDDEDSFTVAIVDLKRKTTEYLVKTGAPELSNYVEEHRMVKPKKNFINVSLGVSSMSYHETTHGSFPQTATTIKGMYNFLVGSNWDVGFSSFLTALPLAGNALKYRFFGFNGRIGKVFFGDEKGRWRFLLMGGFYYLTMYAKDQAFGFADVAGPQVFPSLRHTLKNGNVVGTYFKFSPISNSLALLDTTSREIAMGLSYTFMGSTPQTISIDAALLTLRLGEDAGTSNSLSLSYGIGL